MLIPFDKLDKYAPSFNGVIHGGAHALEEYDYYGTGQSGRNKGRTFWFEADPGTCEKYRDNLTEGDMLFNYALWKESDLELKFNVANNDQSSSLLELGTHATEHPEVVYVDSFLVQTVKLDDMATDLVLGGYEMVQAEFLALDIQGAELEALKGAEELLTYSLKYLYLEVNRKQLYEGCATLPQVEKYLKKFGFKRVLLEMTTHGWGDSFFVKEDLL